MDRMNRIKNKYKISAALFLFLSCLSCPSLLNPVSDDTSGATKLTMLNYAFSAPTNWLE